MIKESAQKIKLTECLEMLGLSKTRYYDWKSREKGCALEDYTSCPKTKPTQMTVKEVSKIKEMVTSKKYSHFTIRALSFYAKKIGAVFASAATWSKLVKLNKWRRPRKRLYPEKPRVGVRAVEPNGIWHIDVTILKLLDGTKVYIQAVIDNYSRYVLTWKVSSVISSFNTKDLLNTALIKATTLNTTLIPEVYMDSGIENINDLVDDLVNTGRITRTIAQIDIEHSNSMVEALFRSAKNNYLYMQLLPTLEVLEKHVDFYFKEHNEVLPYNAFQGATPLEMYMGKWSTEQTDQLSEKQAEARRKRIEYHQNLKCHICDPT